ncbi:hypothetical protein D3Z38_13035 [Clostridiales bacterium]|jgi:hypothetical protein|nr:hypothetical protein [Clostridiales bacterium]RKJ61903.1 hypothetical protein D7Y06_18810 [Roseburia sp. 1XD42-69]
MSEKMRNSGRAFHGFLSAEGARGKLPPTSIFFKFPSFGKLEKSACEGTQAVLAMTLYRLFR